jgi:hypothetical protein
VTYSPTNAKAIAENLNALSASTRELTGKDKVTYKDDISEKPIEKGRSIELKAIEDAITDRTITNNVSLILLIRRPDFLGDSKWDFRIDKHTLDAKIADEEWLDKFKNGLVPLKPGDAMEVDLFETAKYDKNGQLISKASEITRVKNIIHNSRLEGPKLL